MKKAFDCKDWFVVHTALNMVGVIIHLVFYYFDYLADHLCWIDCYDLAAKKSIDLMRDLESYLNGSLGLLLRIISENKKFHVVEKICMNLYVSK